MSAPTSPRMVAVAPARGRVAGLWLLAIVTLLVHLDLTVRRSDRALLTYDSTEYALAGRHLSRTGTLATWFVHPDELGLRPAASGPAHPPFPLIVGHPLVPILDAAVFAIGGARPALTLIPAALAYLLLVAFAAALARRLTGSHAFGLVAGAAVALSPSVLFFASEGLTELPFAAVWMGALVLLADLPQRPRPFVLGLVLGLAHLARPVMVPMLPAWLLGIALAAAPRTRLRALGTALAGFLVFALPLAVYKLVAAGSAGADVARFNLLTYLAPEFSPERIHRMLEPPAPGPYLAAHFGAVLAKLAEYGPAMTLGSFSQAGVVLGPLALLYLVAMGRERETRPVRVTVIVSLATFVLLVTLSLPNQRYLFPMLPPLIVVAAAGAWGLARRLPARSALVTAAIAMLVLLTPALGTLKLWRAAWPHGVSDRGGFSETEWRTLGAGIAARLPAGTGAVASDIGPQVAWASGRAAVLIPNTPAELPALAARLPLGALVLTNHWLIGRPGSEEWRALFFAARTLPGWARTDSVTAGRLRAVLFVPEASAARIIP